MTPTRRDVLKMAAALPTLGAAMSRADAFAKINAPITALDADHHAVNELNRKDVLFHPEAFAAHADSGTIGNIVGDAWHHVASEMMSEYKKARLELLRLYPALSNAGCNHPFILMDEATYGVLSVAYMEAVRAGAAYEGLRRALIEPTTGCVACDGLSVADAQGAKIFAYDAPEVTKICPDCKGTGIVTTATLERRMTPTE